MNKKNGKLGMRMARQMIVCVLVLTVTIIVFVGFSYRNTYHKFYSDKAQGIARMAASLVDGDKVAKYLETGKTDDYYEELEDTFSRIKMHSQVAYLYMYYPEEDQFIYILDASTIEDDASTIAQLGDVYTYGETEYKYLVPDVQAKRASMGIILGNDVGYGRSVSAWAPVVDSKGNLVAMVEADYYLTEVQQKTRELVLVATAIMVAGMVISLLILLYANNRMLTKPLGKVTEVMASYRDGEVHLPEGGIQTGDEIQDVYETFVQMVEKIDVYVQNLTKVTAEKERISTELNVATQIQADMLPNIFPAFPDRDEIDIYAFMQPAKEVGGDFYDFFWIDQKRMAFLIADVSGKGVPAALFMVIAKTIIKNNAMMGLPIEKVFEEVNNQLCEGNVESFFVTSWMGILDVQTGKVEYVNAGHNIPLRLKKDGVEWVHSSPDLVLAAMEGMPYTKVELQLQPGERLLLYTDGVTESVNVALEAYGEERLEQLVAETDTMSVKETVNYIKDHVESFAGEAEQFDDITLLVMEYRGV